MEYSKTSRGLILILLSIIIDTIKEIQISNVSIINTTHLGRYLILRTLILFSL